MRLVSGNANQLLESAHLRKFAEKQQSLDCSAEQMMADDRARAEAEVSGFRNSLLHKMGSSRNDKTKKLQHDDAVHAAILKRKVRRQGVVCMVAPAIQGAQNPRASEVP